ncbi:hypothetical protein EXN22_14005 [Pseudomonas tructae]|uniref:MFS transporter n=1 Tax=Pseudomonas tructae TaxID=2518644 RepID=A0A411MIY1_9PSED|nr:MFS transporter [Pseudomonas tructae]QBF26754.1 hypothetical protein EXN22_14005 [Pseudomonas tructae]
MRTTCSLKGLTVLIWIVNLCAICASTLSYIYLSYYTYKETGSLLYSQIVLFSPMVLPVLFVGQIYRLSDRISPRTLLILSNALALLVAVLVYSLLPTVALIAILGGIAIGTLDALQRVGRIVAIKCYFNSANVESTVPLTLMAQFIAGGIAGATMALVKGDMMPWHALAITAVLFSIACFAAFLLPRAERPTTATTPQSAALIKTFTNFMRTSPQLRRSFWSFIIFVSVYQGFFNVSRIILPAHVLGLSEGYVGLLQAVNSVAALVGAILYYKLNKRGHRLAPLSMAAASALFMMVAAYGGGLASSYGAYFFYIFFFELAFFKLQSDVVLATPANAMPLVASVQYAGVYAGMIITIFFGSLLVEHIGLLWTSVIFAVCYLAATLLLSFSFKPAEQVI